jgi:hypothetical protein
LQYGYDHFGLGGFLVKQILEKEEVLGGSAGAYAARDMAHEEVARLKYENEQLQTLLADMHADNRRLIDLLNGVQPSPEEQARWGLLGADHPHMPDSETERDQLRAEVAKLKGENHALTVEIRGLLAQLQDAREEAKGSTDLEEAP